VVGPQPHDLADAQLLRAQRIHLDDRCGSLVSERDLDAPCDAVHAFTTSNGVPINPLHARWFVSIGCAPCTRAIAPGEPERAGRWWWEQDDKKECGLHSRPPSSAL
jgi:Phosphoadenosine phosphosulfate reductase family